MKIGSNCFLVNCDLAKTERRMCKVLAIVENSRYDYIIAPVDNEKHYISVLSNSVRSPKAGEVKARVRLFD